MCTPGTKIKFCTCKLTDELPEKAWILHRHTGKKEIICEGDPVLPDKYEQDYDYINNDMLSSLNQGDCFDIEIQFKNKDVLVVFLSKPGQVFAFKYTGNVWVEHEKYNPFELMNKYSEIRKGYVGS